MTTQRWFVYGQEGDPLAQLTLSVMRRIGAFGPKERLVDDSRKTRATFIAVQFLFTLVTVMLSMVALYSAWSHGAMVLGAMVIFPVYGGLSKEPYCYEAPAVPKDFVRASKQE